MGKSFFYQEQYGTLFAWGNQGRSNYHAATVSVRERLGSALLMDFNYTLSHSHDNASGVQSDGYTGGVNTGGALIINPLRPFDRYASSDFDIRHIINANAVWELPVGRGRKFFNSGGISNAVLGGWQLSGIFRWNSGLPTGSQSIYGGPFDNARWATNWDIQSAGIRIRPVETCPTRGSGTTPPKLFCDPVAAYQSYRNPKPGENGDRNYLRLPGYVALDMGIAKSFTMPWSEKHKLQLRFEAFNVTNTQRLGPFVFSRTGFGLSVDPFKKSPPPNWSNFTGIQGKPREMQFGLRYEF
jgi:hypothetical protein